MLLSLSDQSAEPLHGQISRQIRARILSGHLPDDTPLPSIRALARELRVSVITVLRAYEDLEREGVIHARRGKGFFVSPLSTGQKETLALERMVEAISPIITDALAQGLSPKKIRQTVDSLIEEKG